MPWPQGPAPSTLIAAQGDGIFEVSVASGWTLRKVTAVPHGYIPDWVRVDRRHGRVFLGLESICDPGPEGAWVVPLAGGRPRFITVTGGTVSVSPNGRFIAFPFPEDGCENGALEVRDLATGPPRVWHLGEVDSVAWAPDGRHIAYSGDPDGNIHLLDTAVPEPANSYTAPGPALVRDAALIDAAVVGPRWTLLVADPSCVHGVQAEP